MSAVELMDDLRMRTRAVKALGELSDGRAWDMLLRLASDDVHALQQAAAEAIGHLGTGDRREEIFELLKRLATGESSSAEGAIIGLRWLNVPEGWAVVRDCLKNYGSKSYTAIKQLGYDDSAETRDLLLKEIHEGDYFDEAFDSARRLFGEESLEPDYQALRGSYDIDYSEQRLGCLRRVSELGDAQRIIELLPDAEYQVCDVLESILLSREPMPVDAAAKGLASDDTSTVEVSARLLGRSGDGSYANEIAKSLEVWQQKWQEAFDRISAAGGRYWYHNMNAETAVLSRLCWAAGRTGGAKKELLAITLNNVDVSDFQDVRVAALYAVQMLKLTKADLDKVTALAEDRNSQLRRIASEILTDADTSRAVKLAELALSDRQIFDSIASREKVDLSKLMTEQVSSAHYQAVVLPHVLSADHIDSLADAAKSGELSEGVRYGAIEGLAQLASEDAEEHLAAVGADDANNEDIRKAAWRGLRRSKRLRKK